MRSDHQENVALLGLAYGRFRAHNCEMTTPTAVVIAAIIIAGTMAFVFRYEVEPAGIGVAYKYDRWTGKLRQCNVQNGRMDCQDE